MRKIREVLRLKYECGRTQRQIAASCGISIGAVHAYLARATKAGVGWDLASTLSDAELEARLFRHVGRNTPPKRTPIDFAWVHRELCKVAVTLQLLWLEYVEAASQAADRSRPYEYSQFCNLYAAWKATLARSMRQVHHAGEKLFLDYSGKKLRLRDPQSGVVREVELFVAVLGASNYTFAEATFTQGLDDFVASTIRAFEYFTAVPKVLVPDQLRSAVSGPDRYEPDLNKTYLEMAQHYGVAVVPARPRKPKDKAKVENGVLVAQRWIVACLRNRSFFRLDELNVAIADLLERLNQRPFQRLEGCRRTVFERIDRPAMMPLPPTRYELATWTKATVNIDYHLVFDERLYSVPHTLIGQRVEIRSTAMVVEIFYGGTRVASHRRSFQRKGTLVTSELHRPVAHRDHSPWPPERMIAWSARFGGNVQRVIELTLARYPHPEQGYRACLGMLRCAEKYGAARTDAACERALALAGPSGPRRKQIEAMLAHGLENAALPSTTQDRLHVPTHEHIRGSDYYAKEEQRDHGRDDSKASRDEDADHGQRVAFAAHQRTGQSALL